MVKFMEPKKKAFNGLTIAVRQALADMADPVNAGPMQAYMKSALPYRGVKAKSLQKVTKSLFKAFPITDRQEFECVVRELWDAEYREERYAAIGACEYYKKFQILESLSLYRFMIETGAWWDLVDVIASHLVGGLLKRYPAEMKPVMGQWIDDPDIWVRRTALLSQLSFKKETDEAMLFGFCTKRMEEKDFWIRKAIGWALREYSKTNPEAVQRFVEEKRSGMSGLTLREASKYV